MPPTMRRFYVWETLYQTAVLEPEERQRKGLVRSAKIAILDRFAELHYDPFSDEYQELLDALNGLNKLASHAFDRDS